MTPDPAVLLKNYFGFDAFRPGQRDVIDHLMIGNSAAAVFPTGGGKSLCYQLPALALPGITLVVSPLIALMKDQIDALHQRNIAAARLDSSLDADAYRQVMDDLRAGKLKLLYVAPERFNNERFRQMIQSLDISLFAIDEAHCISEWGHNFRPDYLKLAGFAKTAKARCVLALTATATPKVLDDIRKAFDIKPDAAIRTGFYRPNLELQLTPTQPDARDDALLDRLRQRTPGPAIVYVTLQKTAEQVAYRLAQAGLNARAYHAGMDATKRSAVQDWFIQSDHAIVVATIAFGMGIDKADIRYVYHYNLPKSLENYAQEIGRAGRDDKPAICETLACMDDLCTLENFVFGDTPTRQAVASLVDEVLAYTGDFDVSTYDLSSAHDMRPLVVRTLLTYLELQGLLEGGTPFYASYKFQPLMPSQEILSRFDESRRAFLASIFKHARKARTWFDLDIDQAAAAIGTSRQRIIAALDYLGEQQMLEVRAAGVRSRYTRTTKPAESATVADLLYQRTQNREAGEIARLNQVVDLIWQNECQTASLCVHFGEERGPCGHCTACQHAQQPPAKPVRACVNIPDDTWPAAIALRDAHLAILGHPRTLTRLLCGVSSPSLTRAKLHKDPLFGQLAQAPFAQVLEQVQAL